MSGVMVSVATGVMTSVIDKLTSLLGNEYRLATDVRRGIRFMRDELSSMNAALLRLAEVDDDLIDVQTKEWRSKVRELSYDIEDCVDRFMLVHSSRKAQDSMVQSMVRKIKELWEDYKIATEIRELKALVVEEKERRDRYNILDQNLVMPQPVLLDPRAPTMYEEAVDLVGIDGPREEIIGLLMDEETQLKVVSVFGIGGQGKTTLAMEVYREIGGQFVCRASVTVSRTPDINKLLRDLLFQINRTEYGNSERWEKEQLIPTLRKHLMDKRYLIIIDDIWDVLAWDIVKSALPSNDKGSRIITTTRIRDVARTCCSNIDEHLYEARPLSEDDSRKLFFRRTFRAGEDCPQELQDVANDILRKCGGLPLAIICISGLLANKSQTVEAWVKVRMSVSTEVDKDSSIDKMRKILFLSYFDLPQYLQSCFLYLSVFPEDYKINCQQLIWTWVAEGLIPGHCRESREEQGKSYLNELINRSMIQPTKIVAGGRTVKYCRVHDVILDFIVSKAVENNFVAVWNCENLGGKFSNKNRRLSIDLDRGVEDLEKRMKNVCQLRSLNIFGSHMKQVSLNTSEFRNNLVLRILNVSGPEVLPLTEVESKKQLIYLRMTSILGKLPEEIGKLQHLEILDLSRTTIKVLPESIVQLQKLVRLFVPPMCVLRNGIGNLKALEELSYCCFDEESAKCIQGMVDLTRLRVLEFWVRSSFAEVKEACISSLSKLLMHLRKLRLVGPGDVPDPDFAFALMASRGWTPPLQKLVLLGCISRVIPSGISSMEYLTHLKFDIQGRVSKEGLNLLASLPALLSLSVVIFGCGLDDPSHVIGRQGFRSLVNFKFEAIHAASLEFEPEAMPKLQSLRLILVSQRMYEPGEVLLGLQNLSSLRHIKFQIDYRFEPHEHEEVAFEENIRGQVAAHPNNPKFEFKKVSRSD